MKQSNKRSVVIVAGGKGIRAGGKLPKQFQPIGYKPMLMRTIEAFYSFCNKIKIIVVLPAEYISSWKELCDKYKFLIPHIVVKGGETRFHSVKNGLSEVANNETVAIHDAARPFVSKSIIERCFSAAQEYSCGIVPVISEKNSMRKITLTGSETINRDLLKIVQTPQVFPAEALKKAYSVPFQSIFTDDASVAEMSGITIKLVDGDEQNIKITTPLDLQIGTLLATLHDEKGTIE